MKSRLMPILVVIVVILCIGVFLFKNGGAVNSSKLVGSWEIDGIGTVMMGATITNSVYTFETNGSFSMTYQATDRVFGQVGTWELRGNVLVTSLTEYVFSPTNRERMVPPLTTKQRIASLDDHTMVWRAFPLSGGLKLNRVKLTNTPSNQ